jgi:hypothetical protein
LSPASFLVFSGWRALGAVAVDRHRLEAQLPALDVGLGDLLDGASLGMLTVLLIAPERNGWTAAIIFRWPM